MRPLGWDRVEARFRLALGSHQLCQNAAYSTQTRNQSSEHFRSHEVLDE